MLSKLKLFLILTLSIFATVAIGIYLAHHRLSLLMAGATNQQQKQASSVQQSSEILAYPDRSHYKSIPLTKINSILQGSDPTTLAIDALDGIALEVGKREIELAYPQHNQAMVTITQITRHKSRHFSIKKYRVEMTIFGRSILVSSPPVWEIVWVGVGK